MSDFNSSNSNYPSSSFANAVEQARQELKKVTEGLQVLAEQSMKDKGKKRKRTKDGPSTSSIEEDIVVLETITPSPRPSPIPPVVSPVNSVPTPCLVVEAPSMQRKTRSQLASNGVGSAQLSSNGVGGVQPASNGARGAQPKKTNQNRRQRANSRKRKRPPVVVPAPPPPPVIDIDDEDSEEDIDDDSEEDSDDDSEDDSDDDSDDDSEGESDNRLSYDEKKQLSLDINALPGQDLGQIVQIIQLNKPSSNPNRVLINFETLDVSTFRAIQKCVASCLKKKPIVAPDSPIVKKLVTQASKTFRRDLVQKVIRKVFSETRRCPITLDKLSEEILKYQGIKLKPFNIQINKQQESTDNNEKNDDQLCIICYDKPLNTVFDKCGHMVTCQGCSLSFKTCPVCRVKINKKIVVYTI